MPVDPFIGEVTMFAGNFAPRGWAFCDGQLIAISSNSALFSILGTVYGGDGRSTFGLPDLRGRYPIGPGNGPGLSPRRAGERGGSETHTLNITEMPNHGHSPILHAEGTSATSSGPFNRMLGFPTQDVKIYSDVDAANDAPMASESIRESNVGGGQSFNKMTPFLGVHYIIALFGTYPSRS